MAIFFDAPVQPDALTTFVRDVPTPGELTLSGMFPARTVPSNVVNWGEITRTNRTARFRSYDGRIHVSSRDTGSEKNVRLPPLSSSLSVGEYERLQLEFARTGGTFKQALAAAVYNDATQLTREVQARVEQAFGDLLTDWKLTIDENGFKNEADYGAPAGHSVSASTTWATVASATALTELVAWTDVYVATNGVKPDSFLTSLKVLRLMQRNAEIINAVHGSAAGRTRVTLTELNDLLESEGLPTARPAYDTKVDVDGTSTRVIADDKLIFLPQNLGDLAAMYYGVSATALELVNAAKSDFSFEDAPGIVGVVIKNAEPPFREFTYVDAVGMPIITNPKLMLVADVVA